MTETYIFFQKKRFRKKINDQNKYLVKDKKKNI